MPTKDLLELSEAALILEVHQSTLRRWADAGKIPFIRTLSGRRRFDRAVVEHAHQEMNRTAQTVTKEQLETRTLDFARHHTGDLSTLTGGWFSHLTEEQVLLFRYSGQRLLGLMMQFISRTDGAETYLEEAKHVAGDYGLICFRAGLSVSQTAEAFLHFRRSILESVQATTGLGGPNDKDGHRIILRTSDFYDALLVATIESYARLSQPEKMNKL